jgi:thiol reductant ABC exporter CydC subunit
MKRKALFISLLRLLTPFRFWALFSILLGSATIASGIGLLGLSAYLIASAALQPPLAELMVAIVGVRFFGLARGIFRYLERLVSHNTTLRILSRLRQTFYQAIEAQPAASALEFSSGELLSRLITDVAALEHFFIRVIVPPAVAAVIIASVYYYLTSLNIATGFTYLGGVLLAGLVSPLWLLLLSRKYGDEYLPAKGALHSQLVQAVQGMADIVAHNQQDSFTARLMAQSCRIFDLQGRMARIDALRTFLDSLLPNLTWWLALFLAIPAVAQGQLAGLLLPVLILVITSSFEAVSPLGLAMQYYRNCMGAAGRLLSAFNAPPLSPAAVGKRLPLSHAGFEVTGVIFRYEGSDRDALAEISFTLPSGRSLAILGPSGAGKSTLANILLGFWQYDAGSIRLGGHELKEFEQHELLQHMAVISQDTYLFNNTIRQNLLLAKPAASEEEILEAVNKAELLPFVSALPHGLETVIGERGLQLSGGERQRLAIARTFLKEAPILLLDEPTANLDAITEQKIMQAMQPLMRNRTTLLITHRLAGLKTMDEIIVLQAGRIIEQGSHRQLLQQSGYYQRMWAMQNLVLP